MSGNNDEGENVKVIKPTEGIETHGSPASEEGMKEDLGQK